ncbi:pilus assembly protein PilN [Asaia spathodeae]|uniref:Pilus assembly protein PilN n=2 Tax=Asaia spathodeae TaxID=657016 RepID=A0ABX2P847_9PROT
MISFSVSHRLAAGVALVAILAGCQDFEAAKGREDETQKVINSEHLPQTALVSTVDAPYLLGDPVKDQVEIPAILRPHAGMAVALPISLREAAILASRKTHIPVVVSPDAEDDDYGSAAISSMPSASPGSFNGQALPAPPSLSGGQPLPTQSTHTRGSALNAWRGAGPWIQYEGDRNGLFQAIATRYGVWAEYRDDHEEFFRNRTKTFIVPAFSGASTINDSISAFTGGSSSGGSGGMGGSGGGTGGGMSGGSSGGSSGSSGASTGVSSVSYKSTADRWKGLQQTAQMMAGGGRVFADEGLGTISVSGTPEEVARVEDWMHDLSETMLKQVAIDIHVYTLKITHETGYGWSPKVAFESAAKTYGMTMVPVAAPIIQSTTTPFNFGATILNSAKGTAGQFAGSGGAIQALSEIGNVTELYERPVVTTNNITAPFQNGVNDTYAAQTSSVLATNAGSSSSITPGIVMSGFAGHVTPKIIGDRIMLHIDAVLQTLLNISTFGQNGSQIQEPKTSSTSLENQVVLKSGSTLMLTGYIDDASSRNRTGAGSAMNWLFGGGGDAQINKTQIIVTVEAHTL